MQRVAERYLHQTRRMILLLFSGVLLCSGSACVLFSNNEPAANSQTNTTRPDNKAADPSPITEKTLIVSTATSPPATLIDTLRSEMRAAAPGAARERHPASKLVGQSCDEISFAYYDTKGDQSQYIGLYRCAMKGAILGISKYDSQVHVIGQITYENGPYSRSIVSALASN